MADPGDMTDCHLRLCESDLGSRKTLNSAEDASTIVVSHPRRTLENNRARLAGVCKS
jgi:hypothetical protein